MFGYGPKLPLTRDPITGFTLTQTMKENIQQNLKNLVLTSPGERIMIPDFGAGLRRFLFEQNTEVVQESIRNAIIAQVGRYMPFIDIREVLVGSDPRDDTGIAVSIKYVVPKLNFSDVLSLRVAT